MEDSIMLEDDELKLFFQTVHQLNEGEVQTFAEQSNGLADSQAIQNRIQERFNKFWETTQFRPNADGSQRFFDHSCSIEELFEKYNVGNANSGLSSTAVLENRRKYSTNNSNEDCLTKQQSFNRIGVPSGKISRQIRVHIERIKRYFFNYRFAMLVACIMYFDAFVNRLNKTPEHLVLSVSLICVALLISWLEMGYKIPGEILVESFDAGLAFKEKQNQFAQQVYVVIRNNAVIQVSPHELVVGDIIQLRKNDIVPVDARIIQIKSKSMKAFSRDNQQRYEQQNLIHKNKSKNIINLSTCCTNLVDWRDSENIVLQGMQIRSGEGIAIVLNDFRSSASYRELRMNYGDATTAQTATITSDRSSLTWKSLNQCCCCGLCSCCSECMRYKNPTRRSVGGEIRFYVAICSIIALIASLVFALISRYAIGQHSFIAFQVAGWTIVAIVPIGLVLTVSFARCLTRRRRLKEWKSKYHLSSQGNCQAEQSGILKQKKDKQENLAEKERQKKQRQSDIKLMKFAELMSDSPMICADLAIVGTLKSMEVNSIWISSSIQNPKNWLARDIHQFKPTLDRLHACFNAVVFPQIAHSDKGIDSDENDNDDDDDQYFKSAMMRFFDDIPSMKRKSQGIQKQPTQEIFRLIQPCEMLGFALSIVKEQTAVGNCVAYIYGDPLEILEICDRFLEKGHIQSSGFTSDDLRSIKSQINFMRESSGSGGGIGDTPTKSSKRKARKHVNKSTTFTSSPYSSVSGFLLNSNEGLAVTSNRLVGFAQKELVGNLTDSQIQGMLFNNWGEVKLNFSEFSLIAVLGFRQAIHSCMQLPVLNTVRLALFTDIASRNALKQIIESATVSYTQNHSYNTLKVISSKMIQEAEEAVEYGGESRLIDDLWSSCNESSMDTLLVFTGLNAKQKRMVIAQMRENGNTVGCVVRKVSDLEFASAADVTLSIGGSEKQQKQQNKLADVDVGNAFVNGSPGGRAFSNSTFEQLQFIEEIILESLQEIENLKKIFVYFAAVKSAEIAPILMQFIFGIPRALSPLHMLLIGCVLNVLPGISLIYERDLDLRDFSLKNREEFNKDIQTKNKKKKQRISQRSRFRIVNTRLVVYAHVVLGLFAMSSGILSFFVSMNSFGVPSNSLIGLMYRKGIQADLNQENANPSSFQSFLQEKIDYVTLDNSVNYGSADRKGVAITDADTSPYWNVKYMSGADSCVQDVILFNSEAQDIDWWNGSGIDSKTDLRKILNVCDAENTQKWLTLIEWTYCETGEQMSVNGDQMKQTNCYTIESFIYSSSMYLAGVIFFSLSCVFAVKSLRVSSFTTKFNWRMIVAILVQIGLAVLVTAAPGFTWFFQTGTKHVLLWGFPATIFSVLVLVHEEIRKILARKCTFIRDATRF